MMIRRRKQRRVLSIALLLCVLLVCMPSAAAAADRAVSEVMRLAGTEGGVTVTTQNGKDIPVINNMKLYSGYRITTGGDSYAYISLDSAKAVKLDSSSTAEIRKSGKKLEILLEEGSLFFNVKVPLQSDETMNIRTSTMVTGIRGTSGIMNISGEQVSSLSLLDGSVTVQTWDAANRRMAEAHIEGGQRITVSGGQAGAAVAAIETIGPQDIPAFAGAEVAKDAQLQERITQLDVTQIIGNAGTEKEGGKEDDRSREDSYVDQSGDTDYYPPSNPGPPVKRPDTSVTITADELRNGNMAELLGRAFDIHGKVTIVPGTLPLELRESLTVPKNRTLVVQTQFINQGDLMVDGTLKISKGIIFTNHGKIANRGEILVDGQFRSYEGASSIASNGGGLPLFVNEGTLTNRGTFQSTIKGESSGGQPVFIGRFVNKEEGLVVNQGMFQLTPGDNFDMGDEDHWVSETGVFFTLAVGDSPSLPDDFKTVCEELGATFYIRTQEFNGSSDNVFAAGGDFQWLPDHLSSEVKLEEDSEIKERVTIKSGREFTLCMQDHTLTFDGGGISNYGRLTLTGSSLISVPGGTSAVQGGALIGTNTDCLIDNRSGSLTICDLELVLESSDTIGGKSCTIDNRSDFYPANISGGTQLSISNDTEEGYALYNRLNGRIINSFSSNTLMTLQSSSEGFTVNAPTNDPMGGEYSGGSGYIRNVTLPGGATWEPALSLYSLRKAATPSQALPLAGKEEPKTATDSNAAMYPREPEEDEPEPEAKATPSQAEKEPETNEAADLTEEEEELPPESGESGSYPPENDATPPGLPPNQDDIDPENDLSAIPEDNSQPSEEMEEPVGDETQKKEEDGEDDSL